MTNLEALKARLNYPLPENSFILALENRALTDSATYAACQSFDLAYADLIMTIVSSPNVSEGGYTINLSDKAMLIKLADGIYNRYGVANPIAKPTATFVQRW